MARIGMCLSRPLFAGKASGKYVVYVLRGSADADGRTRRVYVGVTQRGSSRHSPRVDGSTKWVPFPDGEPEELWSTDDYDQALAVELWAWGVHVQLEPEGEECVRGGPYSRVLFAWRKADPQQAEVALAWCRGLQEKRTLEEAVAASSDLASKEYDAFLHLRDSCFKCGWKGHKSTKCKNPNPPAGGTAEVRRAAHEKSKAAAKAEAERREKAREAANKRQQAKARAAAEARAKAAAEKAAEREEAKEKKKRETHRKKIARARERKATKERAQKQRKGPRREPPAYFRPGVQPSINKRGRR